MRALSFWLLAACCAGASGQASKGGVTLEQLQEVRVSEEARFFVQEQACYERFAVNDCLRQVRTQKRLLMDELRAQEVGLHDVERRKKGADQLELIKEKSSPQKLEEARADRLDAVNAQNEREANAAKKAADRLPLPSSAPEGQRPNPPLGTSRSAEEAAKNKLDFELKVKEAQDHRQSREKSLRQKKTDKSVKPLPLE
jgi:GAF domain-containing protein